MSLDEKQIIETAEKIKNGIVPKEALKELLGGERLDNIFDSKTQQAIFDNIINNGKLHNMTPNGNGLGILNGLLNNQVSSNLSDFYMIKPDYILQLPLEQQRNMANSISGGKQDLLLALQNLWSKQNEYREQQNQKKQKEKKSWELKPNEKARIQKETEQIAQKHREQEEQQKQVPIQQEEYQNVQNIAQPVQKQIPPQQPPMDIGGMEL